MRIRVADGQSETWLEFPEDEPVDVARVLHRVHQEEPQRFSRWCDARGHLRRNLPIFVNGEHIRYQNGLQTLLRDGDTVYIVSLVAGG